MIKVYQPQHIFYLFTEKLNTSEPPPGCSMVAISYYSGGIAASFAGQVRQHLFKSSNYMEGKP